MNVTVKRIVESRRKCIYNDKVARVALKNVVYFGKIFLALAQNIREPSTQAKQLSLLDKKESWTF